MLREIDITPDGNRHLEKVESKIRELYREVIEEK